GFTDAGTGWNQFSIRSSLSGAGVAPRVYAVGDLSIFNNLPSFSGTSANATFYMAEIDAIHAGKSLRISLFDPGDGSNAGTYDLRLLGPGLSSQSCQYRVRGSTTVNTSPTCTIRTRTNTASAPGSGNGTNHFNNM